MPASLRAHVSRATSSSKPYDRRSPTASPLQSESPLVYSPSPPPASPMKEPEIPPDHPGLPTYAEYKRIETTYLHSLSPRKRDKALITQAMFDKIWDVLHQPEACTIATPQFRFWVRKMFTLSRGHWTVDGSPHAYVSDSDDGASSLALERTMAISRGASNDPPSAVVLHEHRPVAIMEQLYELFCYCHVRAGHGGRDKTCAMIREHYSWVPKELTAQFVKACPTCVSKRGGGGGMIVDVGMTHGQGERRRGRRRGWEMALVTGEEKPEASLVMEWPTTGGPLDPGNPAPCGVRERLRARSEVARTVDPSSNSSGRIRSTTHEVPLESCFSDDRGGDGRATYTALSPEAFSANNPHTTVVSPHRVKDQGPIGTPSKLPSLVTALSNDSLDDTLAPFIDGGIHTNDGDERDATGECLPPALRPLRLLGPVPSPDEAGVTADATRPHCLFQIDPVLLSFSYPETELSGGLLSDPGIAYSEPDRVPFALTAFSAGEAQGRTVGGVSIGDVSRSPGLYALRSPPMVVPMTSPDLVGNGELYTSEAFIAYPDDVISSDSLSMGLRSRCHGSRYGASLAMFLPCATDEVGRQLDDTLSLSILTEA